MAELIQFPCPACDVVLRLPLERAGWQGPCPRCGCDIVAPDPQREIGAFLAEKTISTPVPRIEEPAAARVESPPETPSSPVWNPVPPPAPAAADPRRSVLVLSILLSSVVSLVAGYLLGLRSDWLVARTPFPEFPQIPTADVSPLQQAPAPVLVKPVAQPPPEPVPPVAPPTEPAETTEPEKASAAAERALRAFLGAPDWSSRSAYALSPQRVRPVMESYAREHPDGPTAATDISVESSYTNPQTGRTLFIFKVATERSPAAFPVAVAETETGWLVDWESFVEFRDDRFHLFAEGPADRTARFHLLVRKPTPEQAAGTENEHFTAMMVEPPLPGRQRLAYVRKGTETFAKLAAATSGGAITAPVLELAKRTTPDGKSYLEISRILAGDWLPEGWGSREH